MALQQSRVVTRCKSHSTDEAVNAQATGWPAPVQQLEADIGPAARSRGKSPSEHTYGGPPGRRCCTLLLYYLFDLFEFRF